MESFSKVRTKLTILYTSVLAGISIFTAIFLVVSIWFSIEANTTRNLRVQAIQLASAYEISLADSSDQSNLESIELSLREEDTTYQILNDEFKEVIKSENYPLDFETSFYLVQKFFSSKKELGEITEFDQGSETYKICTAAYINSSGKLIMVQLIRNMSSIRAILQGPIVFSVIIILFGIIFSLILGNYLAKRALRPTIESYEKQKTFLADASHELRTPLAVILSNLEAAKGDKKDQERWINNALSEVKFASSVIEDLLFLAKADAGESIIHLEPVDLSYLVLETTERFLPYAQKKGIKLITEISNYELTVLGDEKRISELLTILIDNAVKYTNRDGQVDIELTDNEELIILEVSDNGIGISKEDQSKIFDRFYRVDKARSRKEGGTGLGLSIAQLITKELGINIELKSELNEGATFILTFQKMK